MREGSLQPRDCRNDGIMLAIDLAIPVFSYHGLLSHGNREESGRRRLLRNERAGASGL
jgi:hypothetical protein